MALPLKYNFRNVFIRWRATLATVLGIALVVAVYIMVQSLAAGLERSGRNTGDPRNLMIVRKGSTAESSSQVTREQILTFQHLPQIATDEDNRPLISADIVVLISLPRSDGSGEANVLVRGITAQGIALRPQVSLTQGRWFTPGRREAVVSTKLSQRFENCAIGQTFRTGAHSLTVVGLMEGGNSAFDSEIWIDADEGRSMFDREYYSSVLARMRSPQAAEAFMARMEQDRRLPLRVVHELTYYGEQTRTAKPIKLVGDFLAIAMSIGAVFAGMNTMYASVGARTREIGTLRVLGYRRRTILLGFIIEGGILSAIGGVLGCLLSLFLHGRTASASSGLISGSGLAIAKMMGSLAIVLTISWVNWSATESPRNTSAPLTASARLRLSVSTANSSLYLFMPFSRPL
jgi:putative ABC transport system permease protein